MPGFDSNVFDSSIFDGRYTVPLLRNVKVEPEARYIVAGGNITMSIHLMNAETTYGRRYNLDPESAPQIEIMQPNGILRIPFTPMQYLSQGRYFYTLLTVSADIPGAYSARFKVINGDKVLLSRFMVIFTLIRYDTLQVLDELIYDPGVFDTILVNEGP